MCVWGGHIFSMYVYESGWVHCIKWIAKQVIEVSTFMEPWYSSWSRRRKTEFKLSIFCLKTDLVSNPVHDSIVG